MVSGARQPLNQGRREAGKQALCREWGATFSSGLRPNPGKGSGPQLLVCISSSESPFSEHQVWHQPAQVGELIPKGLERGYLPHPLKMGEAWL